MKTNYTYKPYFLEFAHGDEMKKLNKEWYETFEHYLKVMGIKGWGTPSPNDLTNTIGYNLYNSNEEEDDYAYLLITIPNSFNDSEDNEEWNVFNIYLGEAWDEPTFVFDTIEEVLGLMISNEILIGSSEIELRNEENFETIKHYLNKMGVKGEDFTSHDYLTRIVGGHNVFNTNNDVMNNFFILLPNSFTHNIDKELFSDFVVMVGNEMLDEVSYEGSFDSLEDALGFLLSNKSEVK